MGRTLNPNYTISCKYTVIGYAIVYSQNGAKVYYSIDGAAEQFAGVVSDGKMRITLNTSRPGSEIF